MDLIERAQEREQQDRALALSLALHSAPQLPAIGLCYNCEAALPAGLRFCNSDCRDDHAKRKNCEALRG